MGETVTLSLISHTNVGKTTLARTLLRRDVGEVLDQAHVTEANEAHVVVESHGHTLTLWDTPGFGDTARLMRRLRREEHPIGWLMNEVWDRVADRPQWCSQRAVHNVKEDADVVLYLVNASEDPEDAGYVRLELDLLTWIDRPVVLLLNQVNHADAPLLDRWRAFAEPWPIIRNVLQLDAFTRSWVDESVLLDHVVDVLDGAKKKAMRLLVEAWNERNLSVYAASLAVLTELLLETAIDSEAPQEDTGDTTGNRGAVKLMARALKFSAIDKRRAMERLSERLNTRTDGMMTALIARHELSGSSQSHIERHLQEFEVKGRVPLNERSGAVAGAVLSGALSGVAADILSGGLTLGGGVIAGGIVGALGGSALARGYRLVGGHREPSVRWSPAFLDQLFRIALLRYLAVSHYGRGRGAYRDLEQSAMWQRLAQRELERQQGHLESIWKRAERDGDAARDWMYERLLRILRRSTRSILQEASPHAGTLIRN